MMENREKAFKQLDEIKNKFGLDLIQEFVKKNTKTTKKRRGRPRSGLMTGAEVYFEIFGLDVDNQESFINFIDTTQQISITEGKKNVSSKKGTEIKTIDKHVTKFNKYANDMNYVDFYTEFDKFRHDQSYEEWHSNDYEGIKSCISYYSDEKQEYNNYTGAFYTFGDGRYKGIDFKLAIALILKYKYEKIKNAHNVPKKTDDTPDDLPPQVMQQKRYVQSKHLSDTEDEDLPF